ncbi:hypothetical protein HPB51_001012 [Rhipicephalus microplus]|uniref:AMP-dependent synthetase/ligase domain-containing protein n=1 Tax=Rhipicephalus microplus TaxID=6941 RepID=A0A9J6DEG5_RHIMP|nr:hypothetical protein HPB51_001012 [Rhipicephalus microplus]
MMSKIEGYASSSAVPMVFRWRQMAGSGDISVMYTTEAPDWNSRMAIDNGSDRRGNKSADGAKSTEALPSESQEIVTRTVDYTTSYTRQELLLALERYAAGFQSHGLKLGDHVCVHMRNSVDAFVAVFSLIFAGATIVLAKTSLTTRKDAY